MSHDLDDMERRAFEQIREIQARYRMELEPYIKILTDIRACRPPEPIIIDMSDLTEDELRNWVDRLKASGVIE